MDATIPETPQLTAHWVTSELEFAGLATAWNQLVDRLPDTSIFARHEWFEAAWEWRRCDSELRLLCVFRGDRLVGIVPLVATQHLGRVFQTRTLELLTVPDTQVCDIVAHPGDIDLVLEVAAGELAQCADTWDLLSLRYIADGSPVLTRLRSVLARHDIRSAVAAQDNNIYVDLGADWQSFYKGCSRRLKKGNNHAANRLRRLGDVDIRHVTSATANEDIDELFTTLSRVSSRSWKTQTGTSIDNPGPGAFIHTLTRHASNQGWLSVWLLLLDDAPIAMEYQLIYNGDVHALRADFDEAYEALSPGTYLNWKILEGLFGTGNRCYYMGPGSNPYKLRWTKTSKPLYHLIAYGQTPKGKLLYVLEQLVRPRLKRLLAPLRNRLSRRGADA